MSTSTNTLSFSGSVKHTNGNAIANITITINDYNLPSTAQLQQTKTNQQGMVSFALMGLTTN